MEDIINAVQNSKGLVTNLLTLNKHDYYTYTHSVEVSVLSLGAAIAFGIGKDSELFSIGIGSILHDIGKSQIPPEIINKPGKLTDAEFMIMKGHVLKGKKLLTLHKNIPSDAYYPLLEHHEKLSGTGYPRGLKDEEIHFTGRIVAIADAYDALTTSRPYRKSSTPFEALSIIRDQGPHYDMEIFEEFVKMLGHKRS